MLHTIGDLILLKPTSEDDAWWKPVETCYRRKLNRYAYGLTNDVDSAWDLAQETLWRFHKYVVARPDAVAKRRHLPIMRVLARIALNAWIDHCDKRHDEELLHDEALAEEAHVSDEQADRLLLAMDFRECFEALSPSANRILRLMIDGWKVSELAAETGRSSTDAHRISQKARASIHDCLEQRNWTGAEVQAILIGS